MSSSGDAAVPAQAPAAEGTASRTAAEWKQRRMEKFKSPEHPCAELGRRSTSCSAAMGDAAARVCQQAYRDYRACMQDLKDRKWVEKAK